MRVLIVAAHPDDEVLGCGATAARLSQDGAEIFVGILGQGALSRYEGLAHGSMDEVLRLRASTKRAAELIGAGEVVFEDLPDNRFDSLPLLDIVKLVEKMIHKFQPEVVFTHHGGDLNVDHQVTFRAVLTATRPLTGMPVKGLYAFEIPSSTEWSFGRWMPVFNPNIFFDVTDTLEVKIRAMHVYESEAREAPHPRSPEALRGLARCRGAASGCIAAEAFELIRATYRSWPGLEAEG